MKTSTKALIAFIVIAVIATGILIGGAVIEKDYVIDLFKSITDPNYGYNTEEYNEVDGQSIETINMSTKYGRVEIKTGDEFSLVATTKGTTAEISTENGVFNYKETLVNIVWGFLSNQNSYVLTVPNDKDVILNIESPSGSIELSQYENDGDIKLISTSGYVKVEDARIKNLEITCKSGSITVEDTQADSLKMANLSGLIKIESVTVEGELTAVIKSGSLWLDKVSASKVGLDNTSGNINIDTINVSEKLVAKTLSGNIMIKNPTVPNIDLQCTSGDVIIKLSESLYNFDATCTSGNVKYDGVKKGKTFKQHVSDIRNTITAKTVSGNIDIIINQQN